MEKTEFSTSLKYERGQTDESLMSERGRTVDSLSGHRKKTEKDTDLKIKTDRQDADYSRTRGRVDTDANTVLHRAANKINFPKNEGQIRSYLADDLRLVEQRHSEDAAVMAERLLMDATIGRERCRNDADAMTFLHQETNAMDTNLRRERSHTDSDVQISTDRLLFEQSSHSATKAALTTQDEFLAIVSHDLRNPIGTILSYSELLLDGLPRSRKEEKECAEVIRRNALTSLRLISDILDMERFAQGKFQLQFAPHDIETLIGEAVDNFTHAALEKNIKIGMMREGDSEAIVCDRDRILQVITNLLGNALKFTPEGGSITIKAAQNDNEVLFSVTDSGPGIPEEHQARIFERYTQVHDSDRRGLGLGLYISKMLVEAHGGRLWVSSTHKRGSAFTFVLPRSGLLSRKGTH
jgi:signal transduction histidine kinase